ncbi:MAG: AAA family ATPase, partial [Clostridiales bacterium]
MRFHIVEELYINNNSKVVRILNDVDNTTGIVKIYNQDYYKSNYFSIKKEYDFLKKLSPIEGVLKYYDFFEYENTKAIYMEDIDGISLKKISEIKRLDLEEIIDIIIKIVKTLEKIHENSFIHGNLSLENIIYNENTKKLRLIDFNENSQLANRKINSFINIDKKAFNYYSSPEQCGLINRSIDYRTDFYTVGILFYELVAGKNLFNYNNYKELIYKISYLENRNLEKDYSAIPTSLFDIINMLINKKPENRYRSSQGIINDLLSLKKIILSNELDKLFFVGQDDISEFNYRETEKLSGRDSQIEILKENFNSLNNNDRQVVFIQGEKGVGKTYLVSDFKEYVFKENGIFLNCQLDEFNIKRPLYNLNYLHNELFNLILLGEESIKENIKRDYIGELDENLKDNFKTIGESSLINYEKIINDIDINSEIMIEQYIQKLLKVISKNNIFMVLVFDDFNYIDKSSFKFIESVLLDNEIKNILIVVNYNKEESKVPKIVYDLKQFISENTISFVNIRLDNLNKIELSSYIYDSFMMIESNDDLDRIIDYIFEITKGNFKFAKEMLKYVNDLDVFIS